ncbi:MAG TPA: septum formation initiator family protein [Bacillales bacterium]|nr:septum formation initiator family protein [Bacillales bacterium]
MVSERKKKKVTPIGTGAYIEDQQLYEKLRKKRRRGLTRRLTAFFILIGIAAVSMTSVITAQQQLIAEKRQQKAEYAEKLSHMRKEENKLKEKVTKLKDPDYIGQLARKDYFLTKDGEIVFTSGESDNN